MEKAKEGIYVRLPNGKIGRVCCSLDNGNALAVGGVTLSDFATYCVVKTCCVHFLASPF